MKQNTGQTHHRQTLTFGVGLGVGGKFGCFIIIDMNSLV